MRCASWRRSSRAEQRAQLRLPDQDDLQQLLGLGLEIGEQPDLLEHLGRQVLRLIDDQHHAPTLRVRAQQVAVEQVDQLLGVVLGAVGHAQAELLAQRAQELGGRQPRIEDQRDLGILRRARQQRADGRGLAGTDLAGELDEAAGLVDAVDQMRERIGVPRAQVEVARIRGDRERFFRQPKERQVHPRAQLAVCRDRTHMLTHAWIRGRVNCSAAGDTELVRRKIIDIDDVHDAPVVIGQQLRLLRR